MENEIKTRYSDKELHEFEKLITDKIKQATAVLSSLKNSLSNNYSTGDSTANGIKVLEGGADTAEKEGTSRLAVRQQKFINNLEDALVRIKNGTYGVCKDTGKLISKDRLKAVPHTTQSIDAKLNQQS